jgi:hypothetical protein
MEGTFTSSAASAARSAASAVIAGADASKRRLWAWPWAFATAGRSYHTRSVCALAVPVGKYTCSHITFAWNARAESEGRDSGEGVAGSPRVG